MEHILEERLAVWRQEEKKILVCCGDCKEAEEMWLRAGGTAGHMLSPKQIESWILTGGGKLPKELCFTGSLSAFVGCFPKDTMEESKRQVNGFLAGGVAEYKEGIWEFFHCSAVVKGCCMGRYLSLANRKEL